MVRLFTNLGIIAAAPAITYVGPGDVVSGATGWWGLRAYSAATIGVNAIRLREDGGNTQQDFVTTATGLDLSAIAAFKGANNLFVVKIYDQVSTADFTQATAGSQPAFTLSAIGSLPAIDTTTISATMNATLAVGTAQPYTHSQVCLYNTNGDTFLIKDNGIRGIRTNESVTGDIGIYSGATFNGVAMLKNAWHGVQCVFNGASSDINIDGVVHTGNPGTDARGAVFELLSGFGNFYWVGYLGEFGTWNAAFSGTDSSNMNANQHTYWGF